MHRPILVSLVAALCVSSGASAGHHSHTIRLGVLGDASRFHQQTGQDSTVRHLLISWNQGVEWGSKLPVLLNSLRPMPMLGIGVLDWRTKQEVITPRDIAMGRGDGYLLALNAALAGFRDPAYLRPLPEMNNYHRAYCAFDASGAPAAASTRRRCSRRRSPASRSSSAEGRKRR